MRNKGEALAALLEKLAAGDPLTWTVVGLAVAAAIAIVLLGVKLRRDARREDEARLVRRYGRKQ